MTSSTAPTRPPEPVRLRARRPEDLLAVVPYLLGFHPTESLVALLVRDGRVLLAARTDLPAPDVPGLVEPLQDLVDQHAPESLVVLAYTGDADRGREVLRRHLHELDGVSVWDALLVDGSRWWSLGCTSGCCPAEGTSYAPGSHPFAAEAVYAGLAVSASRDEVAKQVDGPPVDAWSALRALARGQRPTLRRLGRSRREAAMAAAVVAALAAAGPGAPGPDDRTCVRLALLARELRVRDVACALLTRADADAHAALWQRVVARVPPELAAAPLCVLGVAAWASGNGTLLNCCCARLERIDPDCSMGRLLADVSTRALPPSLWDALAAELRRDLGLVTA